MFILMLILLWRNGDGGRGDNWCKQMFHIIDSYLKAVWVLNDVSYLSYSTVEITWTLILLTQYTYMYTYCTGIVIINLLILNLSNIW